MKKENRPLIWFVLLMIMIINLNAKEVDIILEPIVVTPDENE
jgi:hypothetical protein